MIRINALSVAEAEVLSMRRCFEVTEQQRDRYKAERDALKAENERLNGMLSAANWHRAQEEHNALRAENERLSKVVSNVNRRCDHLGIRLGEVIAERDALLHAAKFARTYLSLYGETAEQALEMVDAAIAKVEGGGNG